MSRRVVLTAGLTLLAMVQGSAADQWPQFRSSLVLRRIWKPKDALTY